MDRVDITQGFLNKLPEPTDMPDLPWIQWRVENVDEFLRFLEPFEVRMTPIPGDQLLIQTKYTRGDIQLSPGDCLIIKRLPGGRERLGVVRAAASVAIREADGLAKHSNVDNLARRHNGSRIEH
jgi:hypothetical protein